MNIFKYRNNKNKGFTLIELLVVIAIIGILSSVVLASISSARKKAHESEIRSNLTQIQKAIEMYNNTFGHYPDTNGDWWSESPSQGGGHGLTGPTGWVPNLAPNYIPILPHDKYSGTDRTSFHEYCTPDLTYYWYKSDPGGKNYKLEAFCIMDYFVQTNDPFIDPPYASEGVSLVIYTPDAKNWP